MDTGVLVVVWYTPDIFPNKDPCPVIIEVIFMVAHIETHFEKARCHR